MRLVRAGAGDRDIHLEGLVVRVDDRPRRFVSHGKARAAYEAAIAEALAEGFVEAPDAHADLEARRVLADELQLAGDWRGELIVLQDRMRGHAQGDPALRARATELLASHHAELYGPLAGIARRADDVRAGARVRGVEIAFEAGFASRARLNALPGRPLADTYAKLLALPLARELTHLELGVPATGSEAASYVPVWNAMLAAGVPPNLVSLAVGAPALGANLLGDIAPVVAAIPRLAELSVSGSGELAVLAAPRLVALTIVHLGLGNVLRSELPALRRLTLEHAPRAGAFLDALARTHLVGQLEQLTVRRSGLGDSGLTTLLMHERRLQHLTKLDLSHNGITPARAADAREELPMLAIEAPPR